MTQLEYAIKGIITQQMRDAASLENGVTAKELRNSIAKGKAVLPYNSKLKIEKPCAIGCGLRTKINANIGTSKDLVDLPLELKKLEVAERFGADCIMDLSTGGDLKAIRREIIKSAKVPMGTVPIYEIAGHKADNNGGLSAWDRDDILAAIISHAQDGVSFVTVHCGLTMKSIERLKKQTRVVDIVSRGGAIIANWMAKNKKENPFYEYYDDILKIAKEYDVTLSLGDGLRPGCIADATDRAQVEELLTLGELAKRARDFGVQVMIEGPGHVPLNEIEANVLLEKKLCDGAPFYVLGPLVTDVAAGYDHITAAIGGAVAASKGADFLCYVTPSEHLGIPTVEDVKLGVIASRIAAHAGDIAKGLKGASEWDKEVSCARKKRDWRKQISLLLDPEHASSVRKGAPPASDEVCSMCSEFCSMKISDMALYPPSQ